MELKHLDGDGIVEPEEVLIVPYGIETLMLLRILVFVSIVLIVPYGIETICAAS